MTLAAALTLGSCDQHLIPPADPPAEDPEAALSGEGASGYASQAPGGPEFQDKSLGHAPDLEDFESAVAMLEPGQCLLEYGRANGRWLRFVRTLTDTGSGPSSPFAVDIRLRGGRVVYRATCDVTQADRDRAEGAVSWAPGNGEHAAGRGWPRSSPDGSTASTSGPSRSPLATHIDPFDDNDYDWCKVWVEDGHIVEVDHCGWDDDPKGCVEEEELDGYMGECMEREDIDGGSDPDDPGDPEECDPSEAICEEPELVVECDPLTPVRGTPTSCTASVTEGGSMSDLSWSFTYEGGTLSELESDNPLAGPMAFSGTLRAIAFIDDGPPDTAWVTIDVEPRSWSWGTSDRTFATGSPGDLDDCIAAAGGTGLTADVHGCSASNPGVLMNPGPNQGFSISPAGGPNKGLWYVTNPTTRMDLRTQVNKRYRPDGDTYAVTGNSTVQQQCAQVFAPNPVPPQNDHGVNNVCFYIPAFTQLVDAAWDHEQQHLDLAEVEAVQHDLYAQWEEIVKGSEAEARSDANEAQGDIHDLVFDASKVADAGSPQSFTIWSSEGSGWWQSTQVTVGHQ